MPVYPRSVRAEPVTLSLPRGLALMYRARGVLILLEHAGISLHGDLNVRGFPHASPKSHRPNYNKCVEEDQGYCIAISRSPSYTLLQGLRTPHQCPHRVDQVDHLRLDARVVLHAAECWLVLS